VDFEDAIDAGGEALRHERLRQWSSSVTQLYAPAETPLVEITNRAIADLGSFAQLEGSRDE
jgi:hypothetical protein